MLAALPTQPFAAGDLAGVVSALGPTDAQWGEALTAVLAALPTAHPFAVGNLAAVVRHLSKVHEWSNVALGPAGGLEMDGSRRYDARDAGAKRAALLVTGLRQEQPAHEATEAPRPR